MKILLFPDLIVHHKKVTGITGKGMTTLIVEMDRIKNLKIFSIDPSKNDELIYRGK